MLRDWQRMLSEGLELTEAGDEEEDDAEDAGTDDDEAPAPDDDAETDDGSSNDEPGDDPEPEVERGHAESPNDSLDNQIDSFLVKFERDSAAAGQSESRRRRHRGSRLSEALSLFEADDEDEAGDDEEEGDEDVTDKSEPAPHAAPETPKAPDLNIDDFTQKVARLINNYESMLDVPRSIFDRAMKYLTDGYGDDTASQFTELLAQQHDIEFTDDPMVRDDSEYPVKGPPASGAEGVPSAGGGASGGGALGGAGA